MNDIETWLCRRLGEKMGLNETAVYQLDDLFHAGLDSFDFLQVIEEIEENYKITLDIEILTTGAIRFVRGMASVIETAAGGKS